VEQGKQLGRPRIPAELEKRGTLSREPLPPRGDEPAFLEGGDESLSSLPIVSVDGAPGDALG
jgi:hypothetical protein